MAIKHFLSHLFTGPILSLRFKQLKGEGLSNQKSLVALIKEASVNSKEITEQGIKETVGECIQILGLSAEDYNVVVEELRSFYAGIGKLNK